MDNKSMIKIKDVNKMYQDLTALHDVTLNIKQGEFIALVGMSGGGKSTLLRLIAGLEKSRQQAQLLLGRTTILAQLCE